MTDDSAAISPEKKAEIDKARAKVKELTQELQSKQKELMEAQAKLSQLVSTKVRAAAAIVRDSRVADKPADRGDLKHLPVIDRTTTDASARPRLKPEADRGPGEKARKTARRGRHSEERPRKVNKRIGRASRRDRVASRRTRRMPIPLQILTRRGRSGT